MHLALTRIRMTPAWPYLAPVWRGVSPYWNNYFMCFRFSKMQMEFVTLWYSLFVRSRWNYVKNRPIQLYWHDIKISKKILSWPHSWSRSFYLHCLIKGVFFTHSPLLWVFFPLQFHYHVVNFVVTCFLLCTTNWLATAISLFNISPDLLVSWLLHLSWFSFYNLWYKIYHKYNPLPYSHVGVLSFRPLTRWEWLPLTCLRGM